MQSINTDIINLIQRNLRERYELGTILKELIQNADDAKQVSTFIFGDHNGFPDSNHPLLKGPGLFFYNNGEFSKTDRKAIASFATNTKAGESDSIGKFGLGMKSIFHLCEAFFYLAWTGENKFHEAINPWKISDEEDFHSDWDKVDDSDWQGLSELAESISIDNNKGFFLWVPLRKKSHLYNQSMLISPIIPSFPGDEGVKGRDLSVLFNSNLKSEFSALLALLKHLETIQYKSSIDGCDFCINAIEKRYISDESNRCKTIGRIVGDNYPLMFNATVYESINSIFKQLKEGNDKWPKSYYRDSNGFRQEAKDKSKPEGSVTICHQDNHSGMLTMQWALFLPLGEKSHTYKVKICNSNRLIRIFIHGQFFVDEGRQGIQDYNLLGGKAPDNFVDFDGKTLCRTWNQLIAQQVSLPLVLITLRDYVINNSFKDDEIAELTQAINDAISGGQTTFFQTFRKYICVKNAWIRKIGRKGSKWQIADSVSDRLLPLPAPPNRAPERPWNVFPYLGDLEGQYTFYDGGSPKLLATDNQWPEEELLKVLGTVPTNAFSESTALDYLIEFILKNVSCRVSNESLQKVLLNILLAGFRCTPIPVLRRNKLKIASMVGFILPRYRILLGSQSIPDQIYTELWKCDCNVLLVPKDFDDIAKPSIAKPLRSDVLSWLRAIDFIIASAEFNDPLIERCLDVSNQLLDKLEVSDRSFILRTYTDLKILQATDASSLMSVAVSLPILEYAQERYNLFGFTQGSTVQSRAGFARMLSDVVPDEQILLITAETFKMFYSSVGNLPSSGSGEAVLQSLGKIQKQLGSVNAVRNFIQNIDNPGSDNLAIRGLRYLLHGDRNHFDDSSASLWVARFQQSPAWEKLWRQITGIQVNQFFGVLSRGLAENIPRTRWEILGIKEIEPQEVIAEISIIGTGSINHNVFSCKEMEEILSHVDDEALWKSLPFHKYVDGEFGIADGNCYLCNNKFLPIELQLGIHIIIDSYDDVVLQKQKKWISPLNDFAIVEIALKSNNPYKHWKLIADSIVNVPDTQIHWLKELGVVKWLPLKNNEFVKPCEVIDLPCVELDVQRFASKTCYCYASIADINDDLLNHSAINILKSYCFAKEADALSRLGELMSRLPEYAVGEIFVHEDNLLKVLPVFARLQVLPAWKLLETICCVYKASDCVTRLLPQLFRPIARCTLLEVLNSLAEGAERNRNLNSIEFDAFMFYIALLGQDLSLSSADISTLRLPTKSGQWRRANELCTEATDICPSYVLDDRLALMLNKIIVDAGGIASSQITSEKATSPDALSLIEEYFSPWNGLVKEELIGAFLSVLGADVRSFAVNQLGRRSFEWLLEQLDVNWRCLSYDREGLARWLYNSSINNAFDNIKVTIKQISDNKAMLRSIAGNEIEVPLIADYKTIIAGMPSWSSCGRVIIPLRTITPGEFRPDYLAYLLKNSTEFLLRKCYFQQKVNLDPIWNELNKSDQLEIDVVRNKILTNLSFYLRQLNAHHHSQRLGQAMEDYDNSVERLEEFKRSPNNGDIFKYIQAVDRKREKLAEIFTNDSNAQIGVLTSIRQKLTEYQYDEQSIPFELFQNADDASVELGFIESGDGLTIETPDAVKKFVVDVSNDKVTFMHWGRLINARGSLRANGQTKGFHRDLEKMLVLASSDKPIGQGVTGKFGLGFKSVLLACDSPKVISGDLRFEIVAGILPKLLTGSSNSRLEKYTEDRHYRGTAIELQCEEAQWSAFLRLFLDLASIQCIFGRAIRRIEIALPGNVKRQSRWVPKVLAEGMEVGSCNIAFNKDQQSQYAFVARLLSGVVFFPLNAAGFVCLPENIPSIWVTAPTRERESLGFAVCSMFALDAGRGKLAGNSDANIASAKRLGRELGATIASLIRKAREDWPAVRNQLCLANSISLAGFVASIWRTLSVAANSKGGTGICKAIALKSLEKMTNDPIPNGLPFPYERLVGLIGVQYELSDPWCKSGIIKQLEVGGLNVEQFLASDLAILLRRLDLGNNISSFGFSTLIESIDNFCCEASHAVHLQAIVDVIWKQLNEVEINSTCDELAKLKFKSASGKWTVSRALLCSGIGDKDEDLRVTFAPESSRLSDDYCERGKLFFKLCRPRYDAPTEILAHWIRKADCELMQIAALRYLVTGDLGVKVADVLRQTGLSGTWLEQIRENHEYLASWSDYDKDSLWRRLIEKIYFNNSVPPAVISPPRSKLDTTKTLKAIYEWWQKVEGHQVSLYEREVFPGGNFPKLKHLILKKEHDARKGWMILFLLGAFHTVGWNTYEKNKRFVNICIANGWIDVFVNRNENSLNEWMEVIKEFISNRVQDVEYYQWMKEFISIFTIGYWLDDYVDSFLAINKMDAPFSLSQIVCPRINSAFQAGGPDAPPINRALGMGACFVLRELVRNGFIVNQGSHKFCYVPRRPVRDILSRLGCQNLDAAPNYEAKSRLIHQFLCSHLGADKARFNNSFDLPLLAVAKNPALQSLLFNSIILNDTEIEEDSEYA